MSETIEKLPPVEVKGGVVAYLQLRGAIKAAEFYREAFGAELAGRYEPDEQGRTMHVHLYINGSSLMLSDAYPEHGVPDVDPQGYSIMLPVDDIATWWDRAVAAGAEVVMPYQEMFWGDVYGQLKDPFGVSWAMNQQAKPQAV